jgi:SAM-dependent methyltransferase
MLILPSSEVVRDISANDGMHVAGHESHYFSVGQSALECINCSLQAAPLPADNVHRILDLPCGHGRVLRYLRAAFPEAEIIACDLLRDGVDYCAMTFGAIPLYSVENSANIELERDAFDLIWVGSLLTHLDSDRWPGFLELFRRSLRPGGVLVFSTHGRSAYDKAVRLGTKSHGLPYWRHTAAKYAYERTGFGYSNYANSSSYGLSLSSPARVFKLIERVSELRVVHFSERAWDKHQDVYACVRDPDWQMSHPLTPTLTLLRQTLRVKDRLRNLWKRVRSRE